MGRPILEGYAAGRAAKQVKLGQSLRDKLRVFLDVNFWIWLRDSRAPEAKAFLGRAIELVDGGSLVFPITSSLVWELLKQTDKSTRIETAKVMDRLSAGVVLENEFERAEYEFLCFLMRYGDELAQPPPTPDIWTRPFYFQDRYEPQFAELPVAVAKICSALFLEHAWALTLTDIVSAVNEQSWPDGLDLSHAQTALTLGQSRDENQGNLTTFEQLLRDEIYGSMDALTPALNGAFHRFLGSKGMGSIEITPPQSLARVVANATILREEARAMHPTLYVNAAYHALTRWKRARRFTGNDIYDCDHTAAALGYCHAYFGEAPLCHLLNQGPTHLARSYKCRTAATLPQALAELEGLAAEGVPPW